MHATYWFLVDDEDEFLDDKEWGESLVASFEARYGEYLDENTFWEPEVAVTPSGRIAQLASPNDYRGRDAVYEWYAELPAEKRWQSLLDSAMHSTALELEVDGSTSFEMYVESAANKRIADLSYDATKVLILDRVPKSLAERYGAFRVTAPPADTDSYTRRKMSRVFELFLTSISGVSPFTAEVTTPYEYRAFDLREDTSVPSIAAVALCIDIHT